MTIFNFFISILVFRYNYRIGTDKHPKKVIFLANAVGGLAWFWMLYHIFTEPEHLTVSLIDLLINSKSFFLFVYTFSLKRLVLKLPAFGLKVFSQTVVCII